LQVYKLSYQYDTEGIAEIKQRELKKKLDVLKNYDADLHAQNREDDLIKKPPNGEFIMQKSNFDFMDKPTDEFEDEPMDAPRF
jgi:hypothetical protein